MHDQPRRATVRYTLLPIVCFVLAILGTACGGEDTLVVYSGRSEDLIQPVIDDFVAATDIAVDVRYADSAELALLLTEEGASSPADVFLSQSPGAMGFVDQGGLLQALPSDVLSLAPSTTRDDDGLWIGVTGRQRVLVYNPEQVLASELPASVVDLADPAWSGRVGVAPANGSFQDFVTAMRATLGDEATGSWLAGLAENDAVPYPKNSAIVEAVNRGEVDVGLVNHYYNFRAQAEDANHVALNHQFATDDPGNVLIVTAAAIVGASDQSDDASALIDYLLSEPAQRYFADETFEYPLAPDVAPAASIPVAAFANVGDIDVENLTGGLEATRELIVDAGLDG